MVFSAQAPVPYLSNLGVFYRFHKVHSRFLQHPHRGVAFGQRVRVYLLYTRVHESVIYESSRRFCRQTPTSVCLDYRVADLHHTRLVGFTLVTALSDQDVIFDVNNKVRPPAQRVRVGFQVFIGESYSFDARHAGEIEPIIEHGDAEYPLELLLVGQDRFEVLQLTGDEPEVRGFDHGSPFVLFSVDLLYRSSGAAGHTNLPCARSRNTGRGRDSQYADDS